MPLLSRLQEALEPHLGGRTQAVLKEGLARLGLDPATLDPDRAAILLKRFVYRELQGQMDAASARKVVEETLKNLGPHGGVGEQDEASTPRQALQKALSRFKLYFEWPEVQRLRSLAALVEASESAGESAGELIEEARAQIDLLEEKLQNALLRQARDISDLEDALERVKNIGGPKPRRLRSLLKQIKEAQQQETLATAEVERARKLAADLRKLVESSVVQSPNLVPEMAPEAEGDAGVIALEDEEIPELVAGETEGEEFEILIDFENLEPQVADRIREIDLAEERRRLERLKEQYAAVLAAERVAPLLEEVEAALADGALAGERLDELQRVLEEAFKDAMAEARARYEWLSERLRSLELEDAELGSLRARTQLELIKESLDMGVLPGDLEQAERQVKALEEALAAKKQESVRRSRLLEEARGLVEHAREALPEGELPELAGFRERLALLETGLEAGEVDEALLGRLKAELPELLSQLAQEGEAARALRTHLLAQLDALPDLETLADERESLRIRLKEGEPGAVEAEVEALLERAAGEVMARLEALKAQVAPFSESTGFLDEAGARLRQGRFPDLVALEQEVERVVREAREPLAQELRTLRASAERLREVGGDELLKRISAAEAELQSGLPDLDPLKAQLQTLLERREAWRRELDHRYRRLRERFEAARTVGGETAHRALTLLDFLEKGARRIERLGTKGLKEMEASLAEAEPLIDQLEQEYAAAREVAEQLSGSDLDALLGVFETPPEPAGPAEGETEETHTTVPATLTKAEDQEDTLAPFHTRGVVWVGWLEDRPPQELNPRLAHDLLADLDHLRQEVGARQVRLAVLTLPGHAFLLAPYADRHLVILAEKAQLSRLVTQIHRSLSATP